MGRGQSLYAESAEASHFWAGLLVMPYVAFAGLGGRRWSIVASFLLAQVLVNVYPILHLRFIHGRLDRTIRRIRAAGAGGANARSSGKSTSGIGRGCVAGCKDER